MGNGKRQEVKVCRWATYFGESVSRYDFELIDCLNNLTFRRSDSDKKFESRLKNHAGFFFNARRIDQSAFRYQCWSSKQFWSTAWNVLRRGRRAYSKRRLAIQQRIPSSLHSSDRSASSDPMSVPIVRFEHVRAGRTLESMAAGKVPEQNTSLRLLTKYRPRPV